MDNVFIYGLYILIWPAITLGVLILICTATYRDVKKARRNNKHIVQQFIAIIYFLFITKQWLGDDFIRPITA